MAIASRNERAVTLLAVQYARFMAFSYKDCQGARNVLEQAIGQVKGSLVLFMSQINLLKHLDGLKMLQP